MIILCTGMARSGSTWSFNVVKLLMREHSESTHACYTDDVASSFLEAGAVPEHIIVKCHAPDYFGRFLIKHRMCRTVYTFREPLDALTSAMESFGGEFEKYVAVMEGSLDLLKFQVETGDVHSIWYDDIGERPQERVAALADYLGIACSKERSNEIADMMVRENVQRIISQLSKSGNQTKTMSRLLRRPDTVTSWDSGTLFSDHHIRKAPSAPEDFLTPEQIAIAIEACSGFVDGKGQLLDVVKNVGKLDENENLLRTAKFTVKPRPIDERPSEIVAAARQAFEGRFDSATAATAGVSSADSASMNAVFARLASVTAGSAAMAEAPPPAERIGATDIPPPAAPPIEPAIDPVPFPARAAPGGSPFAQGPNPKFNAGARNEATPAWPIVVPRAPQAAPMTAPIPLPPALLPTPASPAPAQPATMPVAPTSALPSVAVLHATETEFSPPTAAEIAAERVLSRRRLRGLVDDDALLEQSANADNGLAEAKSHGALPGKPARDPLTGEALTPAELAARFVLARRHQQAEIPAPRSPERHKPARTRSPTADSRPKATWADVEQSLLHEPTPITIVDKADDLEPPQPRGGFVSNAFKAIGRLTWGRGPARPSRKTSR